LARQLFASNLALGQRERAGRWGRTATIYDYTTGKQQQNSNKERPRGKAGRNRPALGLPETTGKGSHHRGLPWLDNKDYVPTTIIISLSKR
jgi:hypothetical protein